MCHFDTSLMYPLTLVNRTKVWMWENFLYSKIFAMSLFYFHNINKCLKKVNNNNFK